MSKSDVSSALSRPDLCIVGAGRAGLAAASGAAALGVPTLVIDRDPLDAALPRAGDIARSVLREAARAPHDPGGVDWSGVKARAASAAESRAPAMSGAHLRAIGVRVVQGSARFSSPTTIEAGGCVIEARRIVLATGVEAAIPLLPGLADVPWSCADRWLDLPVLPKSLIVLGAGRTGVETAQWLSQLGCVVTLVDGAAALRGFDPEFSAPVLARLRRGGITIRTGRTVLRAEPSKEGVKVVLGDPVGREETVQRAHLLLATGWRPVIEDLRLDLAGIACAPHGIATRPDGRTANKRVFAIGDVAGRGRSTEAAEAQAGTVLRAALFRQRVAFHPRGVPRLLRTDPEIAVVGLTEHEAREKFGRIGVWRWPCAETDRAATTGMRAGHIKVLTTASKRIVGAGVVGPDAETLIGLWTLAIAQNLTLGDIAALPLGGQGDLSRRAALQGALSGLGRPWIQQALRMMRWLG